MADITLIYKKDGVVYAGARVFVYEDIAGTWTQIDDGSWVTDVNGEFAATELTDSADHIVVFVDDLAVKDTIVRRFVP